MAGKKIWAELLSSVQPWCLQKRDIGTLSFSLLNDCLYFCQSDQHSIKGLSVIKELFSLV